jgi:membrane protein YdbS with pleckstrin-like domain
MARKIGEPFRPDIQFKKLYFIYFFVFLVGIFLWYTPLMLINSVTLLILGSILAFFLMPIFLITLYWIPKFWHSITYKLTKDEMTWQRGVWFKKTGIVPYNRITNVDVAQGPISRNLGIAALKIQTAGYSGQTTSSEIKIEGVKEFNELREIIMDMVRGRKPVAAATYETAAPAGTEDRILSELVKIRKLLEKRK